jgi:RNA-binding protein Nova
VLLLSGSLHSVLTSVFLMLEKLPKDVAMPIGRAGVKSKDDQVKMAVSRKLCGAVIGQKGATIRDFMADSGATIRVQPLSELTPSDSERLITVAGSRDKVLRAVALILNTLSADEKFPAYMDLTLQLAATQGLIPAVRASSGRSALATAKAQLLMALMDEDVGAILGKKGQTLTQIQQNAKVTIKISDRNKMDPHTHEREVTSQAPTRPSSWRAP